MDDRTRDIIDHVVFWAGMAMAATGIVGEILGWWGELGIVLTLGGFLVGLVSLFDLNGRRLLRGFARLEAKQDRMLGQQNGMLGQQDATLTTLNVLVTKQDASLDNQEAMLERQDSTMRVLDRIADILDQRLASA